MRERQNYSALAMLREVLKVDKSRPQTVRQRAQQAAAVEKMFRERDLNAPAGDHWSSDEKFLWQVYKRLKFEEGFSRSQNQLRLLLLELVNTYFGSQEDYGFQRRIQQINTASPEELKDLANRIFEQIERMRKNMV